MCVDPTTALMLAAGGLSAGGQLFAGISGNEAGRRAAQQANINADLALRRGHFEENRVRTEIDRNLDAQTAFVAAGHGDPTYGSPIAVQMLSAMQGETDAMLARLGGVTEAAGQMQQGVAAREKGFQSLVSGVLGAASTMLMAGSAAGKAENWFNNASPFSIGATVSRTAATTNNYGFGMGRPAGGF